MVLINYWDCDYNNAEYFQDPEGGYFAVHYCSHPCAKSSLCKLKNKCSGEKVDCVLLDKPREH